MARLLGTFTESLAPSPEVEAIRTALPGASADLARMQGRTLDLLAQQPSLQALQTLAQLWQQRQVELMAWLDRASERTAGLQDALLALDERQATWTLTRMTQQAAQAPAATLHQIDATLAAIAALRPLNRAQRDTALDLQGQIAQEVVRCEAARAQIAQVQQDAVGGVLARDGPPIWSPEPWAQASAALPARVSEVVAAYSADARAYLLDPSKHLPAHLGLFILACFALLAARGQVRRSAVDGEYAARMIAVFDHPLAAALLLALMAATTYFAPTPYGVKQAFGALAVAPMIVLARPVVHPNLVPVLYGVGVLFALDTLRQAFGGIPPLVDQVLVLLESLAGAGLLIRWLRRDLPAGTAGSGPPMLRRLMVGGVLAILIIGVLASTLGYVPLASFTAPAILVGAVDALWLYAAVEVATAVIAFALRVRPLRHAYMVRDHRRLLESRLHRLLVGLAVLSWCFRYLNYLGLWEPVLTLGGGLLDARLALGSFSTTVGDILAFFGTLAVAYLLSALIRFVLAEEVYPRAGVAAGTSYAASSVFHYAIMAIAFLLALGLLGVTLTQVTVLAGALGVGIGFGLQGVVNNFASGLILLFERPINVGDAVQVGELQGRVRRIGMRASVVRTVQGAEIIVPNAQLTTQQVTNWTLSDQQRRIDLPVGLNYGAAPNQAIKLLEGVACAHPQVLTDPPPQCLFMGYGDSSINFELRAWTDYSSAIQVQSDLTAAVYDAVYAAGLSFPFPQREVRLLDAGPVAQPQGDGGDFVVKYQAGS